jgi:hypothetical protein
LADARTRQENLIAQALQTPGTGDELAQTQAQKALLNRQIKLIQQSSVDQKTKDAAILALRTSIIQTTGSVNSLKDAREKERQAEKDATLDAQQALAEAEGNTKLEIAVINARIRGINQQIAAHKTEGAALNTLKASRATLLQQREQIQDDRLSGRTALAQSVFDLTGNKNPLLRAIDAQIKEAIADRNAARKGSDAWIAAQTAINNFLVQRKNILKDTADKAKQGFTGFEFLQKTQGFASNLLGNLIPGFATAGLVGNASATAGQITDPRTAMLGDDVVTGNRLNDRGVRPVQVDTTNMLLRQILRAVSGANTKPPEIVQNWRTAFAELDTL